MIINSYLKVTKPICLQIEDNLDLFCIHLAVQVHKSFSEALILASTNPQFDKRLFIDCLPVQYMITTSSEHVVFINCSECQNTNKKPIYVHNMF